jgi:peptidoglycan hydrolase-like protein with peptidoglycan-binding domain
MSVRRRSAAAVIAAAIVGGVAVGTAPASASSGEGYISANLTGAVTNDWSDEGTLSKSSHAHSNATALWQAVLYADGYLSASGIDCKFGNTTYAATKKFQKHFMGSGSADGIVGKKSFSNADNRLVHDYYTSNTEVVYYKGIKRKVWFVISEDGAKYSVRKSTSVGYKVAYYNKATACG